MTTGTLRKTVRSEPQHSSAVGDRDKSARQVGSDCLALAPARDVQHANTHPLPHMAPLRPVAVRQNGQP